MQHLFPYKWYLKDGYPAPGIDANGIDVFSCFACGGGSSMGYKLAGYNVIGCNEIDFKMAHCYAENHNPKYMFVQPIQEFVQRNTYPDELYNLGILDGSPPCSSFSMAGNREDDWGKEKKFREGQSEQVLDTLFFDYIELAKKLQPKVVVAENVKGLIMGEAKQYVRKIYDSFQKAGYELRIAPYLLNASQMGVPQRRERVFFIALRKDLAVPFMEQVDMFQTAPKLDLQFNEPGILFGDVMNNVDVDDSREITTHYKELWHQCEKGYSMSTVNEGNGFNNIKLDDKKICPTIASSNSIMMPNKPNYLGNNHFSLCGTYPVDYKYNGNKQYLIGMSVPPVMTAQIANQIYKQWLSKL